MLLDSGATKCFMSKQYYLRDKSLHGLPKFSSKAKVIQVGKGENVNILFIILIIKQFKGVCLKFMQWFLRYMTMWI